MSTKLKQRMLLATSALTIIGGSAAICFVPTVAAAQDASAASAPAQEVVVTGSIIKRKNVESNSPIQVVTAQDLQIRGITTVDQAIQNLSGASSGSIPNGFNNGFAAGASGVSLRGLLSDSTLTLIDGLRMTYYPLGDDGKRNFVDLNAIPDVIIDRVEVLQDGASATYGADAIAGVVNLITKKTYKGMTARVEGGWTEHGGGNNANFQGLIGVGSLASDGFNMYLGFEYQKNDAIYNRDRGYPFNTANFSKFCISGQDCLPNGIVAGQNADGTYNGGFYRSATPVVRAYTAAGGAVPGSQYVLLNPAAGCLSGGYSSTPGGTFGAICAQDTVKSYGLILPEDDRYSFNFRFTKALSNGAEFYAAASYYHNHVEMTHGPTRADNITTPYLTTPRFQVNNIGNGTVPIPGVSTAGVLLLPTFVCSLGSATYVCNGTEPGAKLNPNNPYAAAGQQARLLYLWDRLNLKNENEANVYRLATGLKGDALGWSYSADLTASQYDLTQTRRGYIFVGNALSAIRQGTYNFINPDQNSQAMNQFVSPDNVNHASSKLAQAQINVSRGLFQLPGGTVQLGLGASARYESQFDPSANGLPGGGDTQPWNRYVTINSVFAAGEREVYSAYGEVDMPFFKDAPFIKELSANVAGRYDTYSSGQDHFSPKFGVKYAPFDWITFRGTYSQGFKIPSFPQQFGSTTGYVGAPSADCFVIHPRATSGTYCSYSIGKTDTGNPALNPETSINQTLGIVLQPIRQLTLSVDYYYIKKKGVIGEPDYNPAIHAYYTGAPIPAGFTLIPSAPDPALPNALPSPAFVVLNLVNLSSVSTDGWDFQATYRDTLPWWGVRWTSSLQGTYVGSFKQRNLDGSVWSFVGTVGPNDPAAGAGTPQTRLTWQNSLDYGPFSLAATVYYTSGYKVADESAGGAGTRGDCQNGNPGEYAPSTQSGTFYGCKTGSFTNVVLHGSWQVRKNVQLFFNVDNLFDKAPPLDFGSYAGNLYQPAWSEAGIVGRAFRIGAKATF